MRNHKLAIAAVLSLLMIALLTGSHFFMVRILLFRSPPPGWPAGDRAVCIDTRSGNSGIVWYESRDGRFPSSRSGWRYGPLNFWATLHTPTWFEFHRAIRAIGYEVSTGTMSGVNTTTSDLYIASWMLMLPCTIAPALWLRRRRRQRISRMAHHCRTCGYDLRATPAAQGPLLANCPECGAAAQAAGG